MWKERRSDVTKIIGAFATLKRPPDKEIWSPTFPIIHAIPFRGLTISKLRQRTLGKLGWADATYMKIRLALPFVSVCSSPWNSVTITSQ